MTENPGKFGKKRQANFELLRIVAMIMILTLHYNAAAETLLQLGFRPTTVQVLATVLEAFCIPAMNAYVLITGYFLSKSHVRISRLLALICQVYFYTILISVALMITGTYTMRPDSLYKLVEYIFPISSEHYWFVTAYVLMYALAPVMNAAVEHLQRKQIKIVIILLLVWFCFVKSFVPVMFVTDHKGYDFGWLVVLYLIAAYIRKYDIDLFGNARNGALVYVASCALIAALSIGLYFFNLNFGGFVYYSEVPTHHNFFFTLTGALGLFSFFRYYRVKENKAADVIRFAGPLTFGVYLLHMHVEIRGRWVEWLEHILGEVPRFNAPMYVLHLAACIIIVFLAGIFVDWIRKMIFEFFDRVLAETWLYKKIKEWDSDLC